ncbi:MAG: AmmeMemoRadiSam system protein B [Chloroflexi bacterium]|nr:AmmeMemoRadiSam system protein B [Chloroflexota bacterium]
MFMRSGSPSRQSPQLRSLDMRWIVHEEQPFLLLRDPLELSGRTLLVPEGAAPLLGLMDGTRDAAALSRDFLEWTGAELAPAEVQELTEQLDEALFLETPQYHAARQQALYEYRAAPYRPPALAGAVYPESAPELEQVLRSYGGPPAVGITDLAPITGIISPHIDYQRGGRTYGQVWGRAASAVRAAELVIIFGTDHMGPPGFTLTAQNYATPLGVLPTPRDLVDRLAQAIGYENAFANELHHRTEHSVELAAVWLHHTRQGQPVEMLPILCGSFQPYSNGEADPENDPTIGRVLDILRAETLRRRVLVVAAGDLAHVGTAFGDEEPLGPSGRQTLATADRALLTACAQGDHRTFMRGIRAAQDAFRVCGLPPIYYTLRMLGASRGEVLGYDQCPADAEGGSVVSIAGVVLRRLT